MTIFELHERHFHPMKTQHLKLRPLVMLDAEAMFAYTSVPESFQYLRRSAHTSVEEDRAFLRDVLEGYRQHREFVWGICFQGELVGTCRLFDLRLDEKSCEVSYLIHPTYQRRGIASEAVGRLIRYAFEELDVQKVSARCAVENIGSERVMQKCGMTKGDTLLHYTEMDGRMWDFHLYSIQRNEVVK